MDARRGPAFFAGAGFAAVVFAGVRRGEAGFLAAVALAGAGFLAGAAFLSAVLADAALSAVVALLAGPAFLAAAAVLADAALFAVVAFLARAAFLAGAAFLAVVAFLTEPAAFAGAAFFAGAVFFAGAPFLAGAAVLADAAFFAGAASLAGAAVFADAAFFAGAAFLAGAAVFAGVGFSVAVARLAGAALVAAAFLAGAAFAAGAFRAVAFLAGAAFLAGRVTGVSESSGITDVLFVVGTGYRWVPPPSGLVVDVSCGVGPFVEYTFASQALPRHLPDFFPKIVSMETTLSDQDDPGSYPELPEVPEDPWASARQTRAVPEWSRPEAPARWVPELPDSAESGRHVWRPSSPSFAPPEPMPSAPPSFPAGAEAAPPRRGWMRRVAPLLALSLLAGAAGGAISQAIEGDDEPAAAPVARTPSVGSAGPSQRLAGDPMDVAGVVNAVEPAVAAIEVRYGSTGFGVAGIGAGTGFVLTADGDVLTNAHVVDGASEIFVTLSGESQSRRAELVGADAANDLALLRISGASGLPVAPLGRSADVAVGDDVVAIGNALGLRGGPSVTRGIISALGRSLETDSGTMTGLIQTDASISSGNSGGPLVNAAGEVIGINTAVARGSASSSAENIGFAIPIDKALPIVDRLRGGGPAPVVGFLGVRSSDPADGSRGASIVSVEPGSPAADAGIQEGDLITHINDERVDGAAELGGLIQGYAPGDKVIVSLIRAGTTQDVEVTLAPRQ